MGRLTSGDATRVCDTTSGGLITHRSACTRLRVEVNTSASSRGRLSTRVKFRRSVGDKTPPNLFRPLGVRLSFSLLGWPAVAPLGGESCVTRARTSVPSTVQDTVNYYLRLTTHKFTECEQPRHEHTYKSPAPTSRLRPRLGATRLPGVGGASLCLPKRQTKPKYQTPRGQALCVAGAGRWERLPPRPRAEGEISEDRAQIKPPCICCTRGSSLCALQATHIELGRDIQADKRTQ